MLESLFNKFCNKKEYYNSDALICEKKKDSLTLEQYVSLVNVGIKNNFVNNTDSLNTKNVNVRVYIDNLFKDAFSVGDVVSGLKNSNNLFKDTFDTSLNYQATSIPVLHSKDYASEGLSEREGEFFKEKVEFDYPSSNAIKVYLTKVPFVKDFRDIKQTAGIAAVGLPYAVIDSVVSPKNFSVVLLHEMSHCLGAHDSSIKDTIMYFKTFNSSAFITNWDEKNESLIREGIIQQIKYGQAKDWYY